MPAEQFLLSWKDHNGALVSVFENLLKNNSLVDCTLAAEGQYLRAHKLVLSACSSYFELLFNQESEKNPIVILKEVKFTELESAVNFMYRGEVEVCGDRLAAFLEVADTLQIKGLGSNRCQTNKNKPEVPANSTRPSALSQQVFKESRNSLNENTVKSANSAEMDLPDNKLISSQIQQSQKDTSNSSPSLAVRSTFSLASTSGSGGPGSQDNMESSSPSSLLPSGETVPTDVTTVIKMESVTDAYLEEKSDGMERDFDEVTMMEGQEDWDEPNPESMGDDQAGDAFDEDYSDAAIKSEGSPSEKLQPLHAVDVPAADEAWSEIVEEVGPSTSNSQLPADLGTDTRLSAPGTDDEAWSVIVKEEDGPSTSNPLRADLGTDTGPSAPGTDDGDYRIAKERRFLPTRGSAMPSTRREIGSRQHPSISEERLFSRLAEVQEKTLSCRRCSDVFSEYSQYESHLQHHPCRKRFKCSKCNYVTANKGHYNCHMRIHTGERPYKCEHCGSSFTAKGKLTDHMRIHTGERPYKCPFCDYAAARKKGIISHVRIHTGERPYKCQYCEYTAAHDKSLKTHLPIHTGEKPYKCQHCDYATSRKGRLKLHLRVHTGERPYKCLRCDYSASEKCNLSRHMLIHSRTHL